MADSGPGIGAVDAERIFEPFVRLGTGLAEGSAGTGIGLTISRQLARLHGGDLCLESGENGAIFRIDLTTEAVGSEEDVDDEGPRGGR
jgi:signal transduction histidine kinase